MAAAVLLLIAAAGFVAFCLYDLARRSNVGHLPKAAWAVIILVSIPVGGIIYLVIGRGSAERTGAPVDRPVGSRPDAAGAPRARAGMRPVAGSIQVDRLSKHFGSVVAVDDLSFDVRPGHVTGFLGPNGAGKTTTMRVILGLETPTAGATTVDGRAYRNIVRPLHQVGSLLDANAAHPGRSAWSHILSIAQSNGIPRCRVDDLLGVTGLAPVAHRRVREFSLGMKQRLGLAAALLGDPPVLLFDEPVNGLDPEGIHWIRGLFQSLAAEGRTVFVSSHLMSEMALTADHLIIVGRGRLLADMSTQAFIEANARSDVFVRSPQPADLADVLVEARGNVTPDSGGLSVTGMDAATIAELAAARRIPIYELTPRHASLEEAYLDLTRESVDYRAGPIGPSMSGAER